jgi:hypothetical protein
MRKSKTWIQGSLFEQDFLRRTLGGLADSPEVALTELVANAWDSGASRVDIQIPEDLLDSIIVADDGCGMSPQQFKQRWMTLGYDRVRHQGEKAEFPPDRTDWSRHAFGRNGVGRHGLLCFGDEYKVASKRDGSGGEYTVSTSQGNDPFILVKERLYDADGHGTTLKAKVARNLPSADRIREVISARFLHDPRFEVYVNGQSLELWEHSGLVDRKTLHVDGSTAEVFFIDSTEAARTTLHQGIAFWIGGRLLGTPSWVLGSRVVIDGRSRIAKRHTVVVRTDDFFDDVLPDWSGFRKSARVDALYVTVAEYVEEVFRRLSRERIQETTETVLREYRGRIEDLRPSAQFEVADFIERYTNDEPMVQPESLSSAVRALIQMEQTKSGAALLEKISRLSEEDVEGLDQILETWSVRDAATVLEEIDRRFIVLEALSRFSSDEKADELHTLHPLVTDSRWLFGPEYDSPEFASNLSLVAAVQKVFHKRTKDDAFKNPRKRPDILVLADATISAVATEQIDESTGLSRMAQVLLIELKRGHSQIKRDHVNQATDYVEDLLVPGVIDGTPTIRAFVVGHTIEPKIQPVRSIGDRDQGKVFVATYEQLVRTANIRLFRLKQQLATRYGDLPTPELLRKVFSEPRQLEIEEPAIKQS